MSLRPVICLILIITAASGFSSDSRVVRLDDAKLHHFRLDGGTGNHYSVFRPDGTYSFIDREHMFVEESDRGTWKQDKGGTVTVTSEVIKEDIDAGAFVISYMRASARDRLTTLAATLRRILAENTETTMTPKRLQDLMRLPNGKYLSFVTAKPANREQVTREDLQRLLETAEKAKLVPAIQTMVPRELDGVVFLEIGEPRRLQWFGMELDACEKYIREAKDKSRPFLTNVEIPQQTFDSESSRTQEFRYIRR